MIKLCEIMRRGPEIKTLIWGRTVVAATTGDYLVNLDLWVIFL